MTAGSCGCEPRGWSGGAPAGVVLEKPVPHDFADLLAATARGLVFQNAVEDQAGEPRFAFRNRSGESNLLTLGRSVQELGDGLANAFRHFRGTLIAIFLHGFILLFELY